MLEAFRQEYTLEVMGSFTCFVIMWLYITIIFVRMTFIQFRANQAKKQKEKAKLKLDEQIFDNEEIVESKCTRCLKAIGINTRKL